MPQNPIWTPNPRYGSGAPSLAPTGNVALSDGQTYYDTSTTPYTEYVYHSGWKNLGQGNVLAAAAENSSQPADPVAPASTSAFKMQGLDGQITPARTGKVLVTISGTVISSTVTAGDGIAFQASHGTGTAPLNAGNLAGTQDGTVQEYKNPATVTAADVAVPFSVTVLLTGLVVGTAYWLDLAAKSIGTASSGGLSAINVVAVEVG